MRKLFGPILLVALVLAVPIVPFAILGESFEARIEARLQESIAPAMVAGMVVGLLAVDVVLPVPSSVVSTFAGKMLGFVPGTAASWVGMMLGAIVAFVLARLFGRPLAAWLSKPEELARIDVLSRRFGPAVLVICRPVPVLAEASVLFLGTTHLGWRRFLVPVALANLGIAAVYAALGKLVQLPIALAASIALPILATALAKYLWPATPNGHTNDIPSNS